MSKYDFYGVNIETPMSYAHNTPEWGTSTIGQLTAETDGAVFIEEIPYQHLTTADYGWRVVDAYWSDEDSVVTYFRAYDVDGNLLPEATFGVNYGDVPDRLMGGFRYKPRYGREYFTPIGAFMTPNTGGYTVEVLDLLNPSEGLAFGMSMAGKQHRCLVVSFRLFAVGDGYPNDLDLRIR